MVAPSSELDATGHGNQFPAAMDACHSVSAGRQGHYENLSKGKVCMCVGVSMLICLKLVARVEESDGKANYFLQRELHCTRHLKGHQVETESQGNCFSCSLVVSCLLEEAV